MKTCPFTRKQSIVVPVVYCAEKCALYIEADKGCTFRSILLEIIKLQERLSDVSNCCRGGKT